MKGSAIRMTPAGFTLIELLIAISILALLAVFSWRGLDAIARTSDALTISGEKIDNLRRVVGALETDARHAEDADLPATGELRFLAPAGSVAYRVDNDTLVRLLPGEAPQPVATGVERFSVDLVRNARLSSATINSALSNAQDTTGSSATSTLPSGAAASGTPTTPGNRNPVQTRVAGVRVVLHLNDGNQITRVLLLNGF